MQTTESKENTKKRTTDLHIGLEEPTAVVHDEQEVLGDQDPSLFLLFDDRKRLIGWGNRAESIMGYSSEELANKDLSTFVSHDSRDDVAQSIAKALEGNEATGNAYLVKKDGLNIPFIFRIWPLMVSDRVYLAWLGTVTPLTLPSWREQDHAIRIFREILNVEEGALRLKEKIFSRAFLKNSTPMAITSLKDGRYIAVSNAFLSLTGLTAADIIGKTSVDIGFTSRKQIVSILNEFKAKGHVDNMELEVRTRDGNTRYGLINSSKITMEDEDYLLSVVTDITERKLIEERLRQSEEKYRLGFTHVTDVIFSLDANFHITSVSPSVEKVLGYKPEEISSRSVRELRILTPESFRQAVSDTLRILSGERIPSAIYEFVAKDGTKRFGEISGSPLFNGERIVGLIAVARDITARKIIEDKMQQINAELQQLVAERTAELVRANRTLQQDIKERIRAEEALSRSEEKYRNIFENATDGITQTTFDGRIITANRAMSAMLGYESPAELMEAVQEATTQIYAFPEARLKLRQALAEVGTVKGYETQFIRKDESRIWVSLNLHAVHDSTGQLLYYQGITQDITDRKKAETALADSEDRYRRLVESVTDYIYSVKLEQGRPVATSHSPACVGVTGYRPEEYDADPGLWIRMVHADDRDLVLRLTEELLSGKPPNPIEHRIHHKNGTIRWVINTPVPSYDHNGHLIGYDGTVTDISYRKNAEELLRQSKAMLEAVVDGISDPLIMLDKNLHVQMINRAAKSYYKLASFKQVIGKPCYQAFWGRSEPCKKCKRPLSLMKDFAGSFERKNRVKPGGIEQVVFYPSRNLADGHEATIVRISDITESRLMQRQIVQTEKLASLGLLASGITHEINNPNSFIIFNLPILRDYTERLLPIVDDYAQAHADFQIFNMPYDEFKRDILKLLDNMEHGAKRIKNIIASLKEFTRDRDKRRLRWTELKQIVENGIAICRSVLNKRVKSFEVEMTKDLPPIFTDPEALEQTLINLLINAAQASDKENSWVKLRVIEGQIEPADCVIEVMDNGRGMGKDTRGKIFSPFFTTKGSEGTGLGLYICQTLISGLGGRIEVESKPGKGSTFRVVLSNVQRMISEQEMENHS